MRLVCDELAYDPPYLHDVDPWPPAGLRHSSRGCSPSTLPEHPGEVERARTTRLSLAYVPARLAVGQVRLGLQQSVQGCREGVGILQVGDVNGTSEGSAGRPVAPRVRCDDRIAGHEGDRRGIGRAATLLDGGRRRRSIDDLRCQLPEAACGEGDDLMASAAFLPNAPRPPTHRR